MNKYRFAALLLIVALLLSACGQKKAEETAAAEHFYGGALHLFATPHGQGTLRENAWSAGLTLRQLQLVMGWLDLYYESLACLEWQPNDSLYAEKDAPDRALTDFQIAQRRLAEADLRLMSFSYMAKVAAVERKGEQLTVTVLEDNIQRFAAYPQVAAKRYAIRHQFAMEKRDGEWYLTDYTDSLREILEEYCAEMKEENLRIAFQRRGSYSAPAAEQACVHRYEREKAVEYAALWCARRSPAWPDFSGRGGNCQNFASQCLLAGGIPMDRESGEPWYCDEKGRCSPAWSGVRSFAAYAAQDRSRGLAARADAPYYSGRIGDILQMGVVENCHHSAVITALLQNEEGQTVDYLLNSNTADLENFPASAYPYPYRCLICIDGWNS